MGPITEPEALSEAVVTALNAGDVDALVGLYEDDAVLELPDGSQARGHAKIRAFYTELLADRPRFEPGVVLPALIVGDLALTTTQLGETATAEVARRQSNGTWRILADRPDVRRVVP